MTTAPLHTPTDIALHVPLPPVQPLTLALPDGAVLTISPDVPTTAADRRAIALDAQLYGFFGRLDRPSSWLTGYLGTSGALSGARATRSWTRWVLNQHRILPAAMMLLHRDGPPWPHPYRLFVEAKVLQLLSTTHGLLALLNTHTSAQIASSRLTPQQARDGQQLAASVADNIWAQCFARRSNPWPAPAANTREQAVRIVLRAAALERRALDADEIVTRLLDVGHHTDGVSLGFSVRRDLEQREPLPGDPRITSLWHRGRRLFCGTQLTDPVALAGYDLAHPPRRTIPTVAVVRPPAPTPAKAGSPRPGPTGRQQPPPPNHDHHAAPPGPTPHRGARTA